MRRRPMLIVALVLALTGLTAAAAAAATAGYIGGRAPVYATRDAQPAVESEAGDAPPARLAADDRRDITDRSAKHRPVMPGMAVVAAAGALLRCARAGLHAFQPASGTRWWLPASERGPPRSACSAA